MTVILLVITALVPVVAGLAFLWSGASFARGVVVAAGFLLITCMLGWLWLPAVFAGLWLAAVALWQIRNRRGRRDPRRCSWPWQVWARRAWKAQDEAAALRAYDDAVAEIQMELDSTDRLVPLIKNAPKRGARRVA